MTERTSWRRTVAVGVVLAGLATGPAATPAAAPAVAQAIDCEMARALATWHSAGVLTLTVRAVDSARQGQVAGAEAARAQLVNVELGALVYLAELVAESCAEAP